VSGARPAPPLCEWQPGDAPAIVRHADDYEVWRSLRDCFPRPYTPRDADAWLERTRGASPPLDFAITLDGEAVGGIGLIPGTDIESVFALPFESNLASARVLAKAGYRLEGTLRSAAIKEGRVTNLLLFGRTRGVRPRTESHEQ
jgi:RimJ/RimL family protein N-acetyltransferase